jgi:hypothetical protein
VNHRLVALSVTAILIVASGVTAAAQSLASPLGTVSQKVDSTTISVEYYRPSVRGRRIFGAMVGWGELWTPGANWATTLEVTRDVHIEGQPLPRGKYSVWMIPAAKPDSWTVVLSRAARRFHVMRPQPSEDQLRFRVAADSGPHAEVLTFSFPLVTRNSATLAFQWAETVVPLRLEVQSSRREVTVARPWSSYTGVYELRWEGSDTGAAPIRYEIVERNGHLWVRTGPEAVEPGLDVEFDLLPAGGDEFHPRQYKSGRLIGDEMDELLVFRFDSAGATGFDLRGIAENKVLAHATRVGPLR